jgi:hypothetical protein
MAKPNTVGASPSSSPASKEVTLPWPFHGVHVAPPQAGYEKITWKLPTARCIRVRVRRHTCECRITIYELCMSGGLMFIRRTVRRPEGSQVCETEWLPSAKALELWQRLIAGQVR